MTLDPAQIADPASVSADDVAAEYERRKASLTQPERRRVEQIRFDDRRRGEGRDGEDRRRRGFFRRGDRGRNGSDRSRRQDQSGDARPGGRRSGVLGGGEQAGRRHRGRDQPFDHPRHRHPAGHNADSCRTSKRRSARISPTRAARDKIQDLYNKVEDELAGGATVEEAAAKLSLPYKVIDAVSADQKAPDGSSVSDIPNATAAPQGRIRQRRRRRERSDPRRRRRLGLLRRARHHAGPRPHARRGARRGRQRLDRRGDRKAVTKRWRQALRAS